LVEEIRKKLWFQGNPQFRLERAGRAGDGWVGRPRKAWGDDPAVQQCSALKLLADFTR
jgi:hypothetical protein